MFLCFLHRLLQYEDEFANETIPICPVTKTAVYITGLYQESQDPLCLVVT